MIHRFEEFQTSIQQVYLELQKLKAVGMQEFGLQASHVMCLYELERHEEGMTAAELASACDINKAAISRSIRTLREKGYVAVSSVPAGKPYRAKMSLTEMGRQVAQQMNHKILYIIQLMDEQIGRDELDHVYAVLRQMSAVLKDSSGLPCIADSTGKEFS